MVGNYHELIKMDAALIIAVRSRDDLTSDVPKAHLVPMGQTATSSLPTRNVGYDEIPIRCE